MSAMKLLAGNSNRALAEAVSTHLNIALCRAHVRRFADGEVFHIGELRLRALQKASARLADFTSADRSER